MTDILAVIINVKTGPVSQPKKKKKKPEENDDHKMIINTLNGRRSSKRDYDLLHCEEL